MKMQKSKGDHSSSHTIYAGRWRDEVSHENVMDLPSRTEHTQVVRICNNLSDPPAIVQEEKESNFSSEESVLEKEGIHHNLHR